MFDLHFKEKVLFNDLNNKLNHYTSNLKDVNEHLSKWVKTFYVIQNDQNLENKIQEIISYYKDKATLLNKDISLYKRKIHLLNNYLNMDSFYHTTLTDDEVCVDLAGGVFNIEVNGRAKTIQCSIQEMKLFMRQCENLISEYENKNEKESTLEKS